MTRKLQLFVLAALTALGVGCSAGQSSDELAGGAGSDASSGGGDFVGGDATGGTGGASRDAGGAERRDTFVPEEEEFLVQEVAATEDFVFVPNSDEESSTVARIDGRDLSVLPVRVGLEPVAVRAADVPDVGSVAYVLSEGKSAVSIIRAEKIDGRSDPDDQVSLLPVPEEVNSLEISPDGRHALAYIDPDKPLPDDASVSSLQVAALARLGETQNDDAAHQLSVSRLLQDVEFTEDGSQAFLIGRDGINRIIFDRIDSDAFVPPLDVELSSSAFPPKDREVEVGPEGKLLTIRSSQFNGIALYRPPALDADADAEGELRRISLPEPPTDIDLHIDESGAPLVIASLPQTSQIALIDPDRAFETDPDDGEGADAGPTGDTGTSGDAGPTGDASAPAPTPGVEFIEISGAVPGLAQLTPDQQQALVYTTLDTTPQLGILNLEDEDVRAVQLRNQIRSVAVAPDSSAAVVVHEKQEGQPESNASALEFFQHNHGLTLFDLESEYRRPVTLQADPASVLMTEGASDSNPLLFAMLQSPDREKRGLLRADLASFRLDFFTLPRAPEQIGRVAGKIFVSQESEQGRITFFDIDSGERQTVSGYELNAAIE